MDTRSKSIRFAFLPLALIAAPAAAGKAPDTVFVNGTVITMEGAGRQAEGVAVRDGRIVAVGDSKTLLRSKGKTTRIVDLHGQTLLPGFIDAHGHFSALASTAGLAQLGPPPVGPVHDIASLQQALRDYIAANNIPPGGWVIGFGYDDAQLSDGRHPTRHDLDAVSRDHPILAGHTSGHMGVLNTRALELTKSLNDAPDPPGGVIRREADGKTAAGLLEEAALYRAMGSLGKTTPERALAGLKRAQQTYLQYGVTTAQDGKLFPHELAPLQAAAKNGDLVIDVVALADFKSPWPDKKALGIGAPATGHFRFAGVKLSLDGSPQGRTAWLHDPVPVPPPGKGSDYHGYPQFTDAELHAALLEAAQNGWQVFAHVNGDQAVQQLIDTVAAVNRESPRPLARTIAIHSQVTTSAQLRRMKELDIQPSFFASHTFYWGDWHREMALGVARAERISPQREAIDIGLIPSTHNDTPVVPPDMMRLIWSSVTRRTRSGDILGPLQRVTPYEALEEVTRNAAWQIHEDADKGSIAPGKRADFVVLDRNPLTVPPETIDRIRVTATIKDGRTVFEAAPQ